MIRSVMNAMFGVYTPFSGKKRLSDATRALAARYQELTAVVAGTTLGMMLANVPVVFLGERITRLVPMHWVHRICAAIFIVLALTAAFWP